MSRRCKAHLSKSRANLQALGGATLDEACRAVFAALLWHSQSLREEVTRYMSLSDASVYKPRDGVIQAYQTAESLRTVLVSAGDEAYRVVYRIIKICLSLNVCVRLYMYMYLWRLAM